MTQLKWVEYHAYDRARPSSWRLMEYEKPDDEYYRRCVATVECEGILGSYWCVRFTHSGAPYKPFKSAEDAKAWTVAEWRLS